jgi:hypothetical protein
MDDAIAEKQCFPFYSTLSLFKDYFWGRRKKIRREFALALSLSGPLSL